MPRVSVEYRSASRKAYDKFMRDVPGTNLSFEEWKEIIYTFNYNFRDYILETGARVKLPWGLGPFSISKKKMKKLITYKGKTYINAPINWKKTKEAGKKIYNMNSHTDGYRYKWVWFSNEARFTLTGLWNFKPSRVSSRKIAEYLNKKDSIYAQMYRVWLKR